ncbi:MAG: GFA family protein [Geminicoccaceae bacterium]
MAKVIGGCLCGAVRYEAVGEPAAVVACHCKTCQKYTGSAFSLNLGLPSEAVTVTGEALAIYEDRSGASGKPFTRGYCGRCGSPIFGRGEAYAGMTFLKAGTLDDASWVQPTMHIWTAEKQPWVVIDEDVKQVPGNP